MDHRQNLRFIAAGRIAIGIAMLFAPRRATRGWLGDRDIGAGVSLLSRAFGAREVALGAGTLQALASGGPVRPWVMAGIVSDGLDATASLLAAPQIGVGRALMNGAVASSATAAGIAALEHVD
jgi:hypothetical protein